MLGRNMEKNYVGGRVDGGGRGMIRRGKGNPNYWLVTISQEVAGVYDPKNLQSITEAS